MRPAVTASKRGSAGEEATIWSRREEQIVQLELEEGEAASRRSVAGEEGGEELRGGLARCSAGEEIQT